jgi:hypothetical protein
MFSLTPGNQVLKLSCYRRCTSPLLLIWRFGNILQSELLSSFKCRLAVFRFLHCWHCNFLKGDKGDALKEPAADSFFLFELYHDVDLFETCIEGVSLCRQYMWNFFSRELGEFILMSCFLDCPNRLPQERNRFTVDPETRPQARALEGGSKMNPSSTVTSPLLCFTHVSFFERPCTHVSEVNHRCAPTTKINVGTIRRLAWADHISCGQVSISAPASKLWWCC